MTTTEKSRLTARTRRSRGYERMSRCQGTEKGISERNNVWCFIVCERKGGVL